MDDEAILVALFRLDRLSRCLNKDSVVIDDSFGCRLHIGVALKAIGLFIVCRGGTPGPL